MKIHNLLNNVYILVISLILLSDEILNWNRYINLNEKEWIIFL